jgi:hypothetical protein
LTRCRRLCDDCGVVSAPGIRCALAGLVVESACLVSADHSCEHETESISIVAMAVDDGSRVRTEIDFDASDRSSFPFPLQLCEDDQLTIAGRTPERTDRIDRVVYSVNIDSADALAEIEVVLDRKSQDDTAEFTIPVPPAFDIVTPQSDAMISRGEDFLLEWAPADEGEQIRIGLTEEIGYGLCLNTPQSEHDYKSMGGVVVDDVGSWTIPAGVIASDEGGECEAVYALRRLRPAPYPAVFLEGGFVEGRAERNVAFRSVP